MVSVCGCKSFGRGEIDAALGGFPEVKFGACDVRTGLPAQIMTSGSAD